MDLDRPIDLGRDARHLDQSGTPSALIELVRRQADLVVLDAIDESEVLVEFPLGPIWRGQTGCERFIRLLSPRNGKRYALIKPVSTAPAPQAPEQAVKNVQTTLLPYAKDDAIGARLGLRGAGIMAYLSGEQMHPPMVDDEQLWQDADRWPAAAALHTRQAAQLLGLQKSQSVLDIGCGVGGPARLLADEFDVDVYGISNSPDMVKTAKEINTRKQRWKEKIDIEFGDCQNPYTRGPFDVAWSMNMLYVVPDKEAMLRNIVAVLCVNGRLMVEDWMLTGSAGQADRLALARHFTSGSYAEVKAFASMLERFGFRIEASQDLGYIGRTHLAKYHNREFDRAIRPRLESDFPNPPKSGAVSGKEMADQWVAGITESVRLYGERKLTYLRLVATLSDPGQRKGGMRL